MQWLNRNEIACGGGDQYVSIFDINTGVRLALLKGHTESVKSIAQLAENPFVIASGSRDGSVLIFDVRCNRSVESGDETTSYIRAINNIQKAHFVDNQSCVSSNSTVTASNFGRQSINTANCRLSNVLKSKQTNSASNSINSALKRSSPVACVTFQNEHLLISAGATDGLIKVY